MNILHVYDHLKFGGAETSIITLLEGLYEHGHNVFLATPKGEAMELIGEYISWIELPEMIDSNITETAILLTESVITNEIDVVHVHPFISQKSVALLSMVCPVPITTTVHGNYECPSLNDLIDFYPRQIVISEEIKTRIDNLPLSNIAVIPNGLHFNYHKMKSRNPRYSNSISLLYISRVDEEKRTIFEFLISFLTRYNDVNLKIVGQGNYLEELVNITEKLSDSSKERIRIIGGSADPKQFMVEADFVLGVGRVLLESVSMGIPFFVLGEKGYGGTIDSRNLDTFLYHNLTERGLEINSYCDIQTIDRFKCDEL